MKEAEHAAVFVCSFVEAHQNGWCVRKENVQNVLKSRIAYFKKRK